MNSSNIDLPADKPVTIANADFQPTISTEGNRKLYHWATSNRVDPDLERVHPNQSSIGTVRAANHFFQLGTDRRMVSIATERNHCYHPGHPGQGRCSHQRTHRLTEDMIRAIFNDVALHIHYVGLELYIGRYHPHPAEDVLSNEYGDCKDKHTLLAALLKAKGIESWPVLISGTRELDPDLPSPAQFNHVITLVPLSGKLVWMDSTERLRPSAF